MGWSAPPTAGCRTCRPGPVAERAGQPSTRHQERPGHQHARRRAGEDREEHLRAIPPGDPDHDRLYARRNDTESGNRLLDDSMLRERAHTVGWRRQLLNLTTWAAVRNAAAVTQHARRQPDAPPGLAA
jgi:hypothetical protein